MMAELFIMHKGIDNLKDAGETRQQYMNNFSKSFKILDNRYNRFHPNVLKALENKETSAYRLFTDLLNMKLHSTASPTSRQMYDGSSVCGRDCGNSTANTTSCITGCLYSSAYCWENGGTNCNQMQDSCTDSCCRNFCPEI
jgi:hypothetical protein